MSMGETSTVHRAFKGHPESVGETYVGHARQATRIGGVMIAGGFCCLVHAVFPFLFKRTGSKMIRYLSLVARKRKPQHG
jgi:hypothetical protein